jgi:Mu transposase, C-terminal
MWRNSKVGNAQDKTGIERFFGTYQTTTESEFLHYCNQSIHSRKDNKRSAFSINQALKQTQFSLETMSFYLAEFLLAYNCKKIGKDKTPNELYKEFENPYKIELELLTRVILFHKTTHLTMRRGELKLTYKGKHFLYEILKAEDVLKHNLTTVKVKYDENDLSKVWLLDKYDNLICEAKEKVRTPIATFIQKTQAKNQKIIRLRQEKISKKTKILEEKGITPLTPWALNKELINNVESQYQLDHYLALNPHIDLTKIQPMPTELQKSEFEKVTGNYEKMDKYLKI